MDHEESHAMCPRREAVEMVLEKDGSITNDRRREVSTSESTKTHSTERETIRSGGRTHLSLYKSLEEDDTIQHSQLYQRIMLLASHKYSHRACQATDRENEEDRRSLEDTFLSNLSKHFGIE